MAFHLVEQPSKLPEPTLWRKYRTRDEIHNDMAEIHRQNPGVTKEEAAEILATSNGWLY